MATTNGIRQSIGTLWLIAVAALVAPATGCTSAISTAYLRDSLWDIADHAAEEEQPADDEASSDSGADSWDSAATAADEVTEAADSERRAAAIEEAVARLSKLGSLDEAARATLVETLQRTQQEDWPAVVDAFASTLEEAAAETQAAEEVVNRGAPPVVAASHVVAKADLDRGELPPEPVLDGAAEPEPPAAVAVVPVSALAPEHASPEPVADAAAEPAAAVLAIRNACVASRVQGWGVVERFPDDQLRGGQEVIVYFELDNLSAGESPAGHTTCIDTTLSLVDGSGRRLQEWSFEPIAETCVARRRDYFARYVIRLPESVAADCRVELDVVDTLAGTSAQASLPLRIVAAD